ncbi:MAG: TlpA disulfide reductase family protein [Bacteroidia bacterium]|nr:TlpA disulfide reductase family protein [Bacteroidia bacterium]
MRILLSLFSILFLANCTFAQTSRYDDVLWRDFNAGFVVDIFQDCPTFEFKTIDGEELDTDIFSGQVLILQFVASWCPYSEDQMKSINDIASKWTNKVNVLSVSEDDEKGQAVFLDQISKTGFPFYFTIDNNERIFKLFAQSHSTLPRVIIVNRGGKIIGLFDEHTRRTKRIMKRIVRKAVWG